MRVYLRSFTISLALMLLSAGPSVCTNTDAPSAKPLDRVQVLGLVRGGVADQRLVTLVKEHGISFNPTFRYLAELRKAGAGEGLVRALRSVAPREPEAPKRVAAVASYDTAPRESAMIGEARVLSEEGKWAQAAGEYRLALQLDPNNASALNDLGVALAKTGNLNGAIETYRKAAALSPDLAAVHDNLGVALQKKGDAKGAVWEFRAAVAAQPNDLQAHDNLGLALENQGDLRGAVREYRAALQLDGSSHEAQYNLGRALEKSGDLDGAVAAFQKAVAQKPDNAMAHYGLGTAFESKGDFSAALQQYREAQRLAPLDPVIELAYAKLRRTSGAERAGFRSN